MHSQSQHLVPHQAVGGLPRTTARLHACVTLTESLYRSLLPSLHEPQPENKDQKGTSFPLHKLKW